jgi:hypothetical protein
MSRKKAFNQVSFHPRASIIPHPDTLREHGLGNKEWAKTVSDDDLTATYLITRTVGGADNMNPFKNKPNKSSAYSSYLDNEAMMIRQDPAYRPARSASDLRAAAMEHAGSMREDNECESCGKEIPEGTGYCRNGIC